MLGILACLVWQRFNTPTSAEFKRAVDTAHQATTVAQAERAKALPELATAQTAYAVQRASVLASGNATPREIATLRTVDALLSSVDRVVKADANVIHAQTVELTVWRNKPEPRLVLYGEAMYDWARAQPVARLGLSVHVIGPLALTATGEYAVPTVTTKQQWRGLVGLRITL